METITSDTTSYQGFDKEATVVTAGSRALPLYRVAVGVAVLVAVCAVASTAYLGVRVRTPPCTPASPMPTIVTSPPSLSAGEVTTVAGVEHAYLMPSGASSTASDADPAGYRLRTTDTNGIVYQMDNVFVPPSASDSTPFARPMAGGYSGYVNMSDSRGNIVILAPQAPPSRAASTGLASATSMAYEFNGHFGTVAVRVQTDGTTKVASAGHAAVEAEAIAVIQDFMNAFRATPTQPTTAAASNNPHPEGVVCIAVYCGIGSAVAAASCTVPGAGQILCGGIFILAGCTCIDTCFPNSPYNCHNN